MVPTGFGGLNGEDIRGAQSAREAWFAVFPVRERLCRRRVAHHLELTE